MSKANYFILGVALGFALDFIPAILSNYHPFVSHIPKNSQVQQGYIAPNKLEIECKDLDQNGELETIMKIDGKSYLLKEVDGKPVILDYDVKPAEVVPK